MLHETASETVLLEVDPLNSCVMNDVTRRRCLPEDVLAVDLGTV